MPKLLYHYTTQAGLLGIIESRTIWATRIHYLNDSQEFWHAFRLADNEIERRLRASRDDHEREKLLALKDEATNLLAVGTHVCSFSERGDDLGQWRSYVGNQPGFSLGFDFEKLQQVGEQNGYELHSCIYDKKDKAKRINDLIDSVMETDFNTCPGYADPDQPNRIVILSRGGNYMEQLIAASPRLKHQAFENELEWRLILKAGPLEDVFFRAGKSMITPYKEINLKTDEAISCLTEIIVGPTAHSELAKRAVDELVNRSDAFAQKPRVLNSAAPFRYW